MLLNFFSYYPTRVQACKSAKDYLTNNLSSKFMVSISSVRLKSGLEL